jgi:hypothetical protein
MAATEQTQSRMVRWAEKQGRGAARYVSLHDTIFGVHRYRYFMYRTRYVFISALLRTSVHIAELLLVVNVLPTAVHVLMFARLTGIAVESGWWGLTESMRKRIRWLRREGDTPAIMHEFEGWISLSLMAMCVTIVVSLLIFNIVRHYNPLITSVLVFTIGIQTSIHIINRTFYSGAYAIRRVFLPVEMIILPELLITMTGFFMYAKIGGWSVIVCMLVSTTVGTIIHYFYVRAVTDFLRITPRILFSPKAVVGVFQNHSAYEVASSGLASLCMRLQEVGLVTTIQILSERHTVLERILFPLYITLPLIRSASSWGQVTYFDLTKYGLDCVYKFRNKFERLSLEFSLLLSFCFCALAALLIVMFSGDFAGKAALVILPHIVICSMFGFVLVALYSRQKYFTVATLCCLQYAIFLGLMQNGAQFAPLWLILVYASIVPLIIGWITLLPNWQAPESALRAFSKWLAFVRTMKGPFVFCKFTLSPACTGVMRHRFIKLLMTRIKSGDLVTILPSGSIMLSMASSNFSPHMDQDYWIRLGGGHISQVAILEESDDKEALDRFIGVEPGTYRPDNEKRLDALARHFTEHFPEGILQFPMQPAATLIKSTNSEDRRTILQAAKSQLEGGRMPGLEHWHVTIGTVEGMLACIFLLPRSVHTDRIKNWKKFLILN